MRPIGDASNPFGSGQSFVMVCGFTSGVVSHKEPSVPSSYPQNVKEPRLAPLSRCCHQSEPLERLTALYPDSIRYVKRNVSECAYSVRYHTEMDRLARCTTVLKTPTENRCSHPPRSVRACTRCACVRDAGCVRVCVCAWRACVRAYALVNCGLNAVLRACCP